MSPELFRRNNWSGRSTGSWVGSITSGVGVPVQFFAGGEAVIAPTNTVPS